jgi:Transglutaminase-like superfamily
VKRLVTEGWMILLQLEWIMRVQGLTKMHEIVRRQPVVEARSQDVVPHELVCRAMDFACVLYFKHVLCLQHSSATTVLLRRHGWNAEMVIGAQIVPLASHAWVEIGGVVVNDKPYMAEIYQVLDRC